MRTLVAAVCVTVLIAAVHSISGQDDLDFGKFSEPAKDDLSGKFQFDPNDNTEKLADGTLVINRSDITILPELQSEVAAKRPGVLQTVALVRTGQAVEKDQVIATIDDEATQVQLRIAQEKSLDDIEKRYAKAVLEQASHSLQQRLDANKKSRIYSTSDIKEKQLEVERSALQIEKADRDKVIALLEVEQALTELKTYSIKAPISGRVAKVEKHAGEAVAMGDTIVVIQDLSQVQATGKIPIKYEYMLELGQPVEVQITVSKDDEEKLQIEDQIFVGQIYHIANSADTVNRDIEVLIVVKNKLDRRGQYILKAGYPVKITIPPATAK